MNDMKKQDRSETSPEQLNDYIKVSNPAVWVILVAVFILFAGICIWGLYGRLDTKLASVAVVKDGSMTCYIRDTDEGLIKTGMPIEVEESTQKIEDIENVPELAELQLDDYALHLGEYSSGDYLLAVHAATELADGTYKADIIVDHVAPMSFVFN